MSYLLYTTLSQQIFRFAWACFKGDSPLLFAKAEFLRVPIRNKKVYKNRKLALNCDCKTLYRFDEENVQRCRWRNWYQTTEARTILSVMNSIIEKRFVWVRFQQNQEEMRSAKQSWQISSRNRCYRHVRIVKTSKRGDEYIKQKRKS